MKKSENIGSLKTKDPLVGLCRSLKSSSGQHEVITSLQNLADDLCTRTSLTGDQQRQLTNVVQKTLPHLTNCYSYSPNTQTAIIELSLALLSLKAHPAGSAQELLMKTLSSLMALNVDRVHHVRVAKIIQQKLLCFQHFSGPLFSKLFECLVGCRHCREVRVALIENITKTMVSGKDHEAMECLKEVLKAIDRSDARDEITQLMSRQPVVERITKLVEEALKGKNEIEGLPQLLVLQPYSSLHQAFRQFLKEQPTEAVNNLLQNPRHMQKLLPQYRLILCGRLNHEQLALIPTLLPTIKNIMSNTQNAEQVHPQLDIIVQLIESKFLKGIAQNIKLLQNITQPEIFQISFYRGLVQLNIDTSPFFTDLLNKAVKNGRNFNKSIYPWSDLINLIVDQMTSKPNCYSINQTTFLAIHQQLFEQFLREHSKHQSCWLFLTKYLGRQYHLWRYAVSNICKNTAICRLLSFYSTMPNTYINTIVLEILKKDLHSNDIRSVAAIMQLLNRMSVPNDLHNALVVFISNNWEHICTMAMRRQSTMSKLTEEFHSACQKLGEVEMQMQNNMLIDCLGILNSIAGLENFIPVTPEEFSESVLNSCQERVSQYHLMAYRIVAQLQKASSYFIFDKLTQRYLNVNSISLMQMATCLLVQSENMVTEGNLKTMTWREVSKICLFVLNIPSESYPLQTELLSAKYLALQAYRIVCSHTKLKNDIRQLMSICQRILFSEKYAVGPFDSYRQTLIKCQAVEGIFDHFSGTHQQLKILAMASNITKEEIRFVLLKNCILKANCLVVMALLMCDNSQPIEETANLYVKHYLEHVQPANIIDIVIKLIYCLEFVNEKDRICINFVNVLNGSCMMYLMSTMEQLKEKIVCEQMENAINKRKKINHFKGGHCNKIDISDHPLLIKHPS